MTQSSPENGQNIQPEIEALKLLEKQDSRHSNQFNMNTNFNLLMRETSINIHPREGSRTDLPIIGAKMEIQKEPSFIMMSEFQKTKNYELDIADVRPSSIKRINPTSIQATSSNKTAQPSKILKPADLCINDTLKFVCSKSHSQGQAMEDIQRSNSAIFTPNLEAKNGRGRNLPPDPKRCAHLLKPYPSILLEKDFFSQFMVGYCKSFQDTHLSKLHCKDPTEQNSNHPINQPSKI